jgi:hypothetical protein
MDEKLRPVLEDARKNLCAGLNGELNKNLERHGGELVRALSDLGGRLSDSPGEERTGYITVSFLHSAFLKGGAPYIIEAFGENLYLGDRLASAEYNPKWAFDIWRRFETEARSALEKNGPYIPETIFRQTIHEDLEFPLFAVASMAKYAAPDAESLLAQYAGDAGIRVSVGGYRDAQIGIARYAAPPAKIGAAARFSREKDWAFARFEGENFDGVHFDGVKFRGAVFENCRFDNCEIANSDITDAHFRGCAFRNVGIRKTDLFGTEFENTELTDTLLCESHTGLCDVEPAHVKGWFIPSFWYRCKAENVTWESCNFSGTDFEECSFADVRQTDCNFEHTIFS